MSIFDVEAKTVSQNKSKKRIKKQENNNYFVRYSNKFLNKKSNLKTITLISIIGVLICSGSVFGFFNYQNNLLLKGAEQLSLDEKYEEAIIKLNLADTSWIVSLFGINRENIENNIESNEKLIGEKGIYDKGIEEFNDKNWVNTVTILSSIPEDSFYFSAVQLKIEETKRMMTEEELEETKLAKTLAENRARTEKLAKELAEKDAAGKKEELNQKAEREKELEEDKDNDGLTYREELDIGTSDYDDDTDDDGIIDGLDTHPSGGGRNIPQTFSWSYGGTNWTWTQSIQEDWYDYYKAKSRTSPRSVDYITSDDPFIKKISEEISDGATQNIRKTWLAISFVQSLSYVDDKYTGYDEYPKYPIETFFEKNGDCEDTSYLAASIIDAMNIDSVLVLLPGHMAIGVWMDCDNSGTYYKWGSKCYYYVETTGEGWTAGDISDDYRYASVNLIKVPNGETLNNVTPQYNKPCEYSSDFPGYYYDGNNYYSDSQCNYLAYCLLYEDFYYKLSTKSFYWDSSCSQIAISGCSKSTSYSGYFTNGTDYYYDSRCIQEAKICRISTYSYDKYWDGYDYYWDNNCVQKIVSWCSKSIYYPGYFFNSIDSEIYVDYQCMFIR